MHFRKFLEVELQDMVMHSSGLVRISCGFLIISVVLQVILAFPHSVILEAAKFVDGHVP